MTYRIFSPIMLSAFLAMSACGSSSSDDDGTVVADADDSELSDIEGTELSTSSASFEIGEAATTTEASITVDAGFFDGTLNGTIEIFGETVTITDGAGSLTTGEEVRLTYETNRAGVYAAPIEATVSSSSASDLNGEVAFVVGTETAASVISAKTTGTVTYTGDFQATGSVDGANSQTEYEGGMTVLVDFAGNDADFALDGTFDGTTDVDMEGTGDISGNEISGTLNCDTDTDCVDAGSSAVDATFYGPDAEELGGVLAIDIEVGGSDYDGVGSFVITP